MTTTDTQIPGFLRQAALVALVESEYADAAPLKYRMPLVDTILAPLTPAEVRTEWGVWCHGPEDWNAIRIHECQLGHRQRAVEYGESYIGQYGITCFSIVRREHYIFPIDAPFASASTDWVVDERVTPATKAAQ